MPDERRIAFYELENGKLATEMQSEFEQAQITAFEMRDKVQVTLKITIYPPDKAGEYSNAQYEIITKAPKKKSMIFSTVLRNGLIVSDGKDIAEALQCKLQFPEDEKMLRMNSGNSRE